MLKVWFFTAILTGAMNPPEKRSKNFLVVVTRSLPGVMVMVSDAANAGALSPDTNSIRRSRDNGPEMARLGTEPGIFFYITNGREKIDGGKEGA